MILHRMEIQNFMGIGEGAIDFNRASGITLIKGENHDSPSSVSNGAGKSSVFEALFWVLYGKTKRGLIGDDVVNESVGNNCLVTLYFDDYKLVRGRKPSVLTLFQRDADGVFSIDLTKGTAKDTQDVIDSIIKLSEMTFSKMVYFGQEDVKPFASLTDAELKKVFEQSLGLTFLSDHLEKAKAHLNATRSSLESAQQKSAKFDMEIKDSEDKIELLQRATADLKARKEAEQIRILADMGQHEHDLETIKKEYVETAARSKTAMEALKVHKQELDKLTEYAGKLRRQESEQAMGVGSVNSKVTSIAGDLKAIVERVNNLPGMVGKACETCKRPYSVEDIKAVRQSLEEKYRARAAEWKFESGNAEVMKVKIQQIEEVMNKLNDAITVQRDKVNEVVSKGNPVAIEQDMKRQAATANEILKKIESCKLVLAKLDADEGTYSKDILGLRNWIDDRVMERSMQDRSITELQSEFNTAEMLVDVLGSGGMKSYIFDNVTPALNREINRFAQMLDDIEIEISTVRKLKSGEYREKFHVSVVNRHGSSKYEGNSGGEKQKVNLPIAMGFNKVFRDMSQEAVNVVLLDEPFEALDKGSSEAVIDLCKEFASVGNVFIITHQDGIKDLITDVISVEKSGKKAVIK